MCSGSVIFRLDGIFYFYLHNIVDRCLLWWGIFTVLINIYSTYLILNIYEVNLSNKASRKNTNFNFKINDIVKNVMTLIFQVWINSEIKSTRNPKIWLLKFNPYKILFNYGNQR